jgi:hypothetical protein
MSSTDTDDDGVDAWKTQSPITNHGTCFPSATKQQRRPLGACIFDNWFGEPQGAKMVEKLKITLHHDHAAIAQRRDTLIPAHSGSFPISRFHSILPLFRHCCYQYFFFPLESPHFVAS